MIWSDFEFVIHLACIIKTRILDIIWPCLLIIMIMTWLFSGILFICALVVSFAARAQSARATNDTTCKMCVRANETTWTQINNIPLKSHVIPLLSSGSDVSIQLKHEQHLSLSSSLACQAAIFLLQNTTLRMLLSKNSMKNNLCICFSSVEIRCLNQSQPTAALSWPRQVGLIDWANLN